MTDGIGLLLVGLVILGCMALWSSAALMWFVVAVLCLAAGFVVGVVGAMRRK